MDGSDGDVSSSCKPSLAPKEENAQNYQETGLNLQNTKKHTRNTIVSPTLSAASKANPPRKILLAERNEISRPSFSKIENQKPPRFYSKPTKHASNYDSETASFDLSSGSSDASLTQKTPLISSGVIGFDENDQSAFVNDLSSGPNDPLFNYTSPRPRFLRFKPNRRREIFLRREEEVREVKDELNFSTSASVDLKKAICEALDLGTRDNAVALCPQECPSKEEDEEIDESEELFEEVEEGSGWNWRWLPKFVVLMIVLVVSTLFISSMNSPEHSPAFQAIKVLQHGYTEIQNHVNEFVMILSGGYHSLDEIGRGEVGFLRLNQTVINEGVEGKEEKAIVGDIYGLSEVDYLERRESKAVEIAEGDEQALVDKLGEVAEPENGRSQISGGEMRGKDYIQTAEDIDIQGSEIVELFDSAEHDQVPILSEAFDHNIVSDTIQDILEKVIEVAVESVEEVHTEETRGDETAERHMGIFENIRNMRSEEVKMPEVMNKDSIILEADRENLQRRLIESELLFKPIIGYYLFSAILFSLIWVFYLKKRRNFKKESSMATRPCYQSVVAEKFSTLLCKEEEEQVKSLDCFADAVSLTNSTNDDPKELYQSQAPIVEFIGEFEVGEISSSLRNFDKKCRINDDEVSSNSISWEKGLRSKVHSVPASNRQMGSPSCGSFISDNIITSTQKHGYSVAKKALTSPLRRSSRIRNREIMSPKS